MRQLIYFEILRPWVYVMLALALLLGFPGVAGAEDRAPRPSRGRSADPHALPGVTPNPGVNPTPDVTPTPGVTPTGDAVSLPVFPAGGGEASFALEADRSNVVHIGNGYMVYGDVWLVTPVHKMKLAGSSLFLEFAPGTEKIVRLVGQAWVPSPYGSDYVVIKRPAMAEVGMDFGANLDRLGVPLNEERSYLFFNFNAGFEMEVGVTGDPEDTKAFTISAPVGAAATLVLDPLDPFFYFAGALTTPKSSKSGNDGSSQESGAQADNSGKSDTKNQDEEQGGGLAAGIGQSVKGLIPFRPQTTFGIDDQVREFQGHRIQTGTFPLKKIPVEVSGQMIESVGFGGDDKAVDPLGIGFGPWFERGINGDFDVSLTVAGKATAGMIEFGFPLGSATAAMQVTGDVQHCYLSGIIDPDTSWIPDWMPIKADAELKTYGYLSSEPENFRLHMDGSYAVNAATFGEMAGIDLGNVLFVQGLLHVDRRGFKLSGVTDQNLGPFIFQAKRQVDVWVPFDKDESPYLRVEGLIQIAGMSTEGVLLINRQGAFLNGRLVVPDLDMQVKAGTGVENGNAFLLGEISVPPQFNEALHGEILKEAQAAEQEVSSIWNEYQEATENYEIELSLRGARQAVPPVCDSIISGINSGIENAFKKWPKKWGIAVPGKSGAKNSAYDQAAPMKTRLARVRDRARSGDNESMRAALKAAIQDLLAHQTVKIKVSVLGTIYNKDVISSSTEAWLRKALAAIDSLPESSDRKIRAEQIWNAAPKREVLMETKKAIESGVGAVPRIESMGFHHWMPSGEWLLLAVVSHGGSESEVQFVFDPSNPATLGASIGRAFVPIL